MAETTKPEPKVPEWKKRAEKRRDNPKFRRAPKQARADRAKNSDFEAILKLPERLMAPLRLCFHLSDQEIAFAVDKIRQDWKEKQKAEDPKTFSLYRYAYHTIFISKGKGKGKRRIDAPCGELKIVQKKILDHFLSVIPVHHARHGNQKGCNTKTNAEFHAGAKAVFSIDLMNAFPSVQRSRIRANLKVPFSHFLKQQFGEEMYGEEDKEKMLEAVVDLLCVSDRLPQGPPPSPRILDIVCLSLDREISLAIPREYRYTVWADNLMISSGEDEEIPEEIQQKILGIIRAHGFVPHSRADKTEYFSKKSGKHCVALGVTIPREAGKRVTIAPKKVDYYRGFLHAYLGKDVWGVGEEQVVQGTIAYIRSFYPVEGKLPSKIREVVPACEARIINLKLARLQSKATEALATPAPA